MSCANFLTPASVAMECASFPASMSTWVAVTTIDAICASLTPWAYAPAIGNNSDAAQTMTDVFMGNSLRVFRRPLRSDHNGDCRMPHLRASLDAVSCTRRADSVYATFGTFRQ